ncbi:zinc-binding dehydrogenase [Actinocorallia aurea]
MHLVEFGFTPPGADLADAGALAGSGAARVSVEEVLPLADAAKADELSETGRPQGKIVLLVAEAGLRRRRRGMPHRRRR